VPNRRYRIDLIINADQAQRANRTMQQGAEQTVRAYRRTAQAAQQSTQQQTAGMIGLYKVIHTGLQFQSKLQKQAARDAQQAIKQQTDGMVGYHSLVVSGLNLQSKLQKQAALAARQAQREQAAAARQAQREQIKLQREQAQAARVAMREQAAAERQAQREQAQAARQAQKEQLKLQREQAAAARAVQREQIQLQKEQERAQQRAAAAQQRQMMQGMVGLYDLKMSAAELRDKLDEASGAFKADMLATGMRGVALAAGMIVGQLIAGKQQAFEAQKMIKDYTLALRELAALKGFAGNTPKALAEDLQFRAATLQSRDESIAFQNAALGSGEAAINENPNAPGISKSEFKKAMQLTGAFQAVEGGSAETHGTLAGIIPLISGKRMTGEDVAREEQRLYNVFKPGGASFTSLAKQYSDISQFVSSKFYSPEDASALLSAFSTTKRDKAGTTVEAFTRATVGGQDRNRGSGIEGSEKQGEYLRGLGVNDQMTAMQIGDLIVADLKKQEDVAAKKGLKANPYNYLTHHGYRNIEDINAVLQYKGLKDAGVMESTFLPLSRKTPTLAEATLPVEVARATTPELQDRKGELAADLANLKIGDPKTQNYYALQRMAFEKLKAQGSFGVTGDYENFAGLWNTVTSGGAQQIGLQSVYGEMERMMNEERKKVGLAPKIVGGKGDDMRSREDFYFESSKELAAKGSDFGTRLLQQMLHAIQDGTEEQRKLREAYEKAAKARAVANPGAAPPFARAFPP
jgi:hypothetical protein